MLANIVTTALTIGLAAVVACSSGCDTDLGQQVGKVLSTDGGSSDVKIGMSYHGPDFNSSVNGARLAIAPLNHAGGVHGNQLVLLPRNNLGDPSYNLGVTEALIVEDGIAGMIGAEYSSVTIPMSRVAQRHRISTG